FTRTRKGESVSGQQRQHCCAAKGGNNCGKQETLQSRECRHVVLQKNRNGGNPCDRSGSQRRAKKPGGGGIWRFGWLFCKQTGKSRSTPRPAQNRAECGTRLSPVRCVMSSANVRACESRGNAIDC